MEIKVGDLVIHSYSGIYSYGIVYAIDDTEYWTYFNNDEYRKTFSTIEYLTKVGPWCLGTWDKRK